MKKILIQIVMILCAITITTTTSNAQTKTKRKVATTTKSVIESTNKPQPLPEKRIFKGALRYAEALYITKAGEILTYSPNISGISMVTKIISGNKIHIINERLQHHTIIDKDNDKYIVYSELTNEGYIFNLSTFEKQFFNHLALSESLGWKGNSIETYKGEKVIHSSRKFNYQVDEGLLAGEWNSSGEMFWNTQFLPAPIMSHIQGDFIMGIPVHSVIETSANLNYGYLRKVKAEELLELYEYEVSDDEFRMPKFIKVLTSKRFSNVPFLNEQIIMKKMYKQQLKVAKKEHLLSKSDREVTLASIQQTWPNIKGAIKAENKIKSVFQIIIEGYGKDNFRNDISDALIQTSETIRPLVSQGTVVEETDIEGSLGRQNSPQDNKVKSRRTVRDVVNTNYQNFVSTSSDDRHYRRNIDMLIGCKYGGVPACDPRDRTKIQKEMKEIRERNEKKGIWKLGKSEWEDWDGK